MVDTRQQDLPSEQPNLGFEAHDAHTSCYLAQCAFMLQAVYPGLSSGVGLRQFFARHQSDTGR